MLIWIALALGLTSGYFHIGENAAVIISDIFMRLMRLLSVPVIFFALLSTFLGLSSLKRMGGRVVTYTTLTTMLSATVALVMYRLFNPTLPGHLTGEYPPLPEANYQSFVLHIVPGNLLEPFLQGNVMGVMFLALIIGFAFLSLPEDHRAPLRGVVEGFFQALMVMVRWLVKIMPLAVWAFMVLFVRDLQQSETLGHLVTYACTVAGANMVHGLIVLPLFLVWHRLKPIEMFRAFSKALSFAFFSKSSVATMPIAIDCAVDYGVKPQVARFCYPLCTSINMNACAGFILITVLFISAHHGVVLTLWDQIMWVGIATLAAIGNAGVPMGCFFLASSLLSVMGVPLYIMGLILPFYTLLDMLETAINIWSDSCVTCVVDAKMSQEIA